MSTATTPSRARRRTSATKSAQLCVVDAGPRDPALSNDRPAGVDADDYSPPPGVLRLTISTQGGGTELALIPFPETYEDAQRAAVDVLAPHLQGVLPENVELRGVIQDRDGSWTTAAIRPRDWNTIVPTCYNEVMVASHGMRDSLQDARGEEDETPFIYGRLFVTAGTMKGGLLTWTSSSNWGTITRPACYERCFLGLTFDHYDLKLLKQATRPGDTTAPWAISRDGSVKMCTFPTVDPTNKPSTQVWLPLPAAAYTSPACWRRHMPGPEGLIGVARI
ncbi:hypothetical protein DFP72DRAFT_922483 [Ephemerocybe angulata]|uniref:Uncharacterized protein n=1 Tax=Ephemerocybe angulata TaxID=980116 RepID=A0A8H6LZD4_9AGAR|nr:hypothetical protein DFP72DRAFT_922483 [Tulosesus angulatus]